MKTPVISYNVESRGGEIKSQVYRVYDGDKQNRMLVRSIRSNYTDAELREVIELDEEVEKKAWDEIELLGLTDKFYITFRDKDLNVHWKMPLRYDDVMVSSFFLDSYSAPFMLKRLVDHMLKLKSGKFFVSNYGEVPYIIAKRNDFGSIENILKADNFNDAQEAVEQLLISVPPKNIVNQFEGRISLIHSMASKEQLLEDLETKVGILRIFHPRTEASRELLELYEDYKRSGTTFEEVKALRDDIIRYIEEEK